VTIQRIGVVGAGMMGAEIALVFALADRDVLVHDENAAALERLRSRLERLLDKGVAAGAYTDEDRARALARLRTSDRLDGFADREMVVEAVFEDEAVKREVFERLDRICPSDCVLSSNTSSISISTLAAAVKVERRAKFLGTHFFSPVSRMRLVEVVRAFDTAPATVESVMAVCREAGKEPIMVKDVVGFAVNRLLHIFWIEANRLVEEGVASAEDIDKACKLGLGHPVGPYELMDLVSNNLTLQVQEILHEAYGPRFLPRPLLKQMVNAGRNGRQSGRGWYDYR
jgi:3-hydroxybutyryl-CoA dehydrogenase